MQPQPTGPFTQGFGNHGMAPTPAPLMPQQTGPPPPVRFGVTEETKKLMPQATGRRANLSAASKLSPRVVAVCLHRTNNLFQPPTTRSVSSCHITWFLQRYAEGSPVLCFIPFSFSLIDVSVISAGVVFISTILASFFTLPLPPPPFLMLFVSSSCLPFLVYKCS